MPASLPLSEVFAIVSFPCLFRGSCEDLSKAFGSDLGFGQSVIVQFNISNLVANYQTPDIMSQKLPVVTKNPSQNKNLTKMWRKYFAASRKSRNLAASSNEGSIPHCADL